MQPVVTYLLDKGADLESASYGGLRPLHHACNNSKEAIIVELLERGANPNTKDENENTALHWAAARYLFCHHLRHLHRIMLNNPILISLVAVSHGNY